MFEANSLWSLLRHWYSGVWWVWWWTQTFWQWVLWLMLKEMKSSSLGWDGIVLTCSVHWQKKFSVTPWLYLYLQVWVQVVSHVPTGYLCRSLPLWWKASNFWVYPWVCKSLCCHNLFSELSLTDHLCPILLRFTPILPIHAPQVAWLVLTTPDHAP